jgi:hypothetical protein
VTALASRRRRSTVVAFGAVALTVTVAIGIAIVGGLTLYHSTEGVDAADDRPERTFPDTPTGLIAAIDDEGRLASLAVFVVQPSGSGGSVITVPVSADASAGEGRERLPVAETAQLSGIESVPREVEILLGLSIDSFEIADRAHLEALLRTVGDIEVDLPADVTDSDGHRVAEAGHQTLDPATAAAVLVARDPSVPGADQYPAATAVWKGIAQAVGDGIDVHDAAGLIATPQTTAGAPGASTEGMADVVTEALSGPLGTRGLQSAPLTNARNPRDVDVVVLDRAELALVFGQIAPGRVSAPNPALSFRLEVPYSDADLEESGLTRDEIAYRVISQLLYIHGNVVSVDTTSGDVPVTTTIGAADESLVTGANRTHTFLGDVDVQVADARIVGVDAVIRLGQSYLDLLNAEDGGD